MNKLTTTILSLLIYFNVYCQFGPSVEIVKQLERTNLFVDFDLDGDIDMIGFGENITFFANDGSANFSKSNLTNDWAVNASSYSNVTSSDLNNDGFPDILLYDFDESKLVVYYNQNGLGLGSEVVIYTGILLSFRCIDVNTDGKNDIVLTTSTYATSFIALLNQGNGQFIAQSYVFTETIENFCDWDFDGDIDILTHFGDQYYAVFNDGTGNFNVTLYIGYIPMPMNIKLFDIDNDNDTDIVFTGTAFNSNTLLKVKRNSNNIQFEPEETFMLWVAINSAKINVTDLNNDGYVDVLLSGGNYYGYALNFGDGTFSSAQSLNFPISPLANISSSVISSLADYNGDGITDIFSLNEWLFLSNGILSYEPRRRIQEAKSGPMRLININSDTLKDLVYVSDTFLYCRQGINDTTFSTNIDTIGTLNGYPNSMHDIFSCDINQDGLNDVVYFMPIPSWNTIRAFVNNGNGTFSSLQIANLYNSNLLRIADIDGDNFPDIIYASLDGLFWRKNLGNLTFGSEITLLSNTYNYFFECADIDGDSDIDILFSNNIANGYEINYLPNTGTGTFNTPIQIDLHVIGNTFSGFLLADFNNDSLQDFAYEHSIFNNTLLQFDDLYYIYIGDGTGSYTLFNSMNTYNSTDKKLVDFNHDGRIDLAATKNNKLFAHFQLPDGSFTDPVFFNEFIEIPVLWYEFYGQNNDLIYKDGNTQSGIFKAENNFGNYLTGKVFVDENASTIQDANENIIPNHAVLNQLNSTYCFSNSKGEYIFYDLANGLNEINPASIPFFQSTTNSPYQFINTTQTDSVYRYDFGVVPTQATDSINVSLTGGISQCGFSTNFWMNLSNIGSTEPSGIIEMVIDSQIVYITSTVTPDSIVGQHLYWHYDSLAYFQDTIIVVEVEMPDFNSMGDTLQSYVVSHIMDGLGGIVLSDTDTLSQILTCAYDPNDKTAIPAGIGSNGYIPLETDWLEYIIRFQNTGNDTAIQVVLTDQLDTKFDWGSLQLIASSHPVNITISAEGLATFAHNFINLPDSLTDESGSQGFVRYKLQIKNNAKIDGAKIYNSASIYFDYNPPIYTNTTINTFYTCSNILAYQIPTDICFGDTLNATVDMGMNTGSVLWNYNSLNVSGEQFSVPANLSGQTPLTISIIGDFCSNDTSVLVSVHNLPIVSFSTSIVDPLCSYYDPLILDGALPVGGNWIGESILNGQFYPNLAANGSNWVYYSFTDSATCVGIDSMEIFVDSCLTLNEMDKNAFSVYPNPLTSYLNLVPTDQQSLYSIRLISMSGSDVMVKENLTGNICLNTLSIDSGVYYLIMTDFITGKRAHYKIVRE